MNRLSEYDIRKEKLQTLRELGIEPYAQTWDQTHTIASLSSFDASHLRSADDILLGAQKEISLAGRLMLKRVSGKLSF